MAKQIIILDQVDSQPGHTAYRVAYWLVVPVARRPFYADPDATSAWSGASAPEIADLQSGAVVEVVDIYSFPSSQTLAQIKSALQTNWQTRQDAVNAKNLWGFYGSFWDGTAWTGAGVV